MAQLERVLIANRGEIARRILRTCRDQGLFGIAVYSEADADAPFVQEADLAVAIGPAPAGASYLNVPAVLDAARRSGADAIHPGYGFLSEDGSFAQAVLDAGLIWIGPSPAAMAALGDKAKARQLALRAGVHVNPGYDGDDQSEATMCGEAARIGFPLLVKAAAGGGGRGMRRVDRIEDLPEALVSAREEAARSFGHGGLLLERLVLRARHVEVQLLADSHGTVLHLGERDCSVQRRHQKVLEEAPAPGVSPALRNALGEAACALARAAGYVGAGTAEFLLHPDGQFTFLEVNARLQVEHPVTELVTGLDLVALQLRIARGLPLGLTQADIQLRGHAIEARLIAEDPSRDFAPGTGRLHALDLPTGAGIRLDIGVSAPCEITPHYDAMIGKLIAYGPDRDTATQRLLRVVRQAWAPGLPSNLPLLRDLLAHPLWRRADLSTSLLSEAGLPAALPLHPELGALLATALLATSTRGAWPAQALPGFRLGPPEPEQAHWRVAGETLTVQYQHLPGAALQLQLGDTKTHAHARQDGPQRWQVTLSGLTRPVRLLRLPGPTEGTPEAFYLHFGDGEALLELLPRLPDPAPAAVDPGTLLAPTPGTVTALHVQVGDHVHAGQRLVTLEAMKMAHPITAPADGRVSELRVALGDAVQQGQLLLKLDEK